MPEKRRKKFTTVSLPTELIEGVDVLLTSRILGYESRAEFIKDAIRRRFQELNFIFPPHPSPHQRRKEKAKSTPSS